MTLGGGLGLDPACQTKLRTEGGGKGGDGGIFPAQPPHCLLAPRFWAQMGAPSAGRFPDTPLLCPKAPKLPGTKDNGGRGARGEGRVAEGRKCSALDFAGNPCKPRADLSYTRVFDCPGVGAPKSRCWRASGGSGRGVDYRVAAKAGRSPVQELVLGAAGGTRTGSTSPRPGLGRKFFAGESSTWGVSDMTGQTGPEGVSKVEAQRGAAPGWAAAEGRQVEARVGIPVLPGLAGRAPTSAHWS